MRRYILEVYIQAIKLAGVRQLNQQIMPDSSSRLGNMLLKV